MPWKECNAMDERVKFIARFLEGGTGPGVRGFAQDGLQDHRALSRHRLGRLTDRSRRPYRHANQLPFQIEALIVRLKQEKPSWGAPKILELLARRYPDIHRPAISTIHAVLDRHGLVKRRTGRKNKAAGTVLTESREPNDLWCADYKGEFMLADRRYCYPLTITDHASRYLFAVEALESTKEINAFTVFERVF